MDGSRPSGGTEPPPAGTPAGIITSVPCPGCGVAVAVGYPRCPKCHAPVPQPARSRRATAREELIAGGTSVAPEAGGGYGGLFAVGALVLVGIGVMVWMSTRDDRPARPSVVETEDDDGVDDDDADDRRPGVGDDEPIAPPPQPAPAGSALRGAIKDLDDALRGERVWSKVGVDGASVVVESALCGDPSMPPILNEHLAALRDAGATALRCQEPHGGVVFATDL